MCVYVCVCIQHQLAVFHFPPSPPSFPSHPEPTGTVSGFVATEVRGTDEVVVVNMTWSPLPEHQWNGVPLGYRVYILRHADQRQDNHSVLYPTTSLIVGVVPGVYDIHIVAINGQGESLDVLEMPRRVFGRDDSSASFVEYPYFYILIPGVIFLVVIVVIIIVIVKKVHENKKRSITFVRGRCEPV